MNDTVLTKIPDPLAHVLDYLHEHGYETPYQEIIDGLPDTMDLTEYNPLSKYKEDYIHDLFAYATKIARDQTPSHHEKRDRLFEVLMRRFDLLLRYRPLLRAIHTHHLMQLDPLVFISRFLTCEKALLCTVYGECTHTFALNEGVFTWLYVPVFLSWLRDSSDFEKTMAKLDTAISQYETFFTK